MEIDDGNSGALPSAMEPNTSRIFAEKTSPAEAHTCSLAVAITTQGVDGYHEKAMRIASVAQAEFGNIVEMSVTGHARKWAGQSNFSGRTSLSKVDGWSLKNHCHLTFARHLREKTHTSLLIVTLTEGEERGIW